MFFMWILLWFIVGSCLGSFVLATVERIKRGSSLRGRSACFACHQNLAWYDLVPLVSYLLLGGKCRNCHQVIPRRTWYWELAFGTVVAIVAAAGSLFSVTLTYQLVYLSVFGFLSLVFVIDLLTGYIPDLLTYPAIIATLLILIGIAFYTQVGPFEAFKFLAPRLLAGLIPAAIFSLLIVITKGRAMGWGDVKLMIFMGLVLGFPAIIVGLYISFILGALVSSHLLLIHRKKLNQAVPFGPFLSLGTIISLIWADQITKFYWHFFSY